MTRSRFDLPLLLFGNLYGIVGIGVALLLIVGGAIVTGGRPWWIYGPSVAAGLLILAAAVQSIRRFPVRRRIYRLLERRLARDGFRREHFKNLSHGRCLLMQHRLLFYRQGIYREYAATMAAHRREGLLFFEHPDPAIEDELNRVDPAVAPGSDRSSPGIHRACGVKAFRRRSCK